MATMIAPAAIPWRCNARDAAIELDEDKLWPTRRARGGRTRSQMAKPSGRRGADAQEE